MLRAIFIVVAIGVGGFFAVQGSFQALLFYLWIAYFRPESWVYGSWLQSLNLSFIAGLWLVTIALLRDGQRLRLDPRLALLFVFLLHNVLSTALSDYADAGWNPLVQFVKSIVVTYLIVINVSDRDRFRTVLVVIALSLGVEGAKQGWAELFLRPGAKNTNSVSFLPEENSTAVAMLMLVPILAALAKTRAKAHEWYLYNFLIVGVVYKALTSYSRGAFLSAAALATMYLLRSQRKVGAIVATALVCVLVLPALPDAFWARMQTITASEEERDQSVNGRLHFWQVAVQMANDRPVFGQGHWAYNSAYNRYDFSGGAFGENRSVHSIWFGALGELGYVGLLLFLVNVGMGFLACRRVRKLAAQGGPNDLATYATALETALVVFCVGGSFAPLLYAEILWHFVGLTIGVLGLAERVAADARSRPVADPVAAFPLDTPALTMAARTGVRVNPAWANAFRSAGAGAVRHLPKR